MAGYESFVKIFIFAILLQVAKSNRCLTMLEEVKQKRIVRLDGETLSIRFQISQRITQRMASRVMRIFLMEVLGYASVDLVDEEDYFNASRVFESLSDKMVERQPRPPESMVNMEVWLWPQQDTAPLLNQYNVKECGSITSPGYFGWFVPRELSRPDDTWVLFTKPETASRFDISESLLPLIENSTIIPNTTNHYCQEIFCHNGMYIPKRCSGKNKICALLIASNPGVTKFVKEHIDELKLYVKVAWVGPQLKKVVNSLQEEYARMKIFQNRSELQTDDRSLVILHWTPSAEIPNKKDFNIIEFPRCSSEENTDPGCSYETSRLVKLVWARLQTAAKFAYQAINLAKFTDEMYEDLIGRYNKLSQVGNYSEDDIACDWLKTNYRQISSWMPVESNQKDANKNPLYIGGIFPMTGSFYTASSILLAARMAKDAINDSTILADYSLNLLASDGACRTEMVMKAFIDHLFNYYDKLVGILGPACSETVEPLVGISKHYNTVVVSYSAEGSSFSYRSKYPGFFRTIGENKQYKHVYLQLFQKFGWHRVASLTEDGQKYTEYISYMQDVLGDNGISFIANVKFPRERDANVMNKYLLDLKQKRARIIIADVYDVIARQVMCEAYKLEMTSAQGYVWFLPVWLPKQWYDTDSHNESVSCSTSQMLQAINGYLGISHAYFADDNDTMQEGITVKQWREKYERACEEHDVEPSDFAGYVYDAMWTYAYALDKLAHENQSYISLLHNSETFNRLTNLIADTDFNGVSGRIKFLGGLSRYSVIKIFQHVDNDTHVIGNFYPNISETKHEIIGGVLDLNISDIVWFYGSIPDDGSEPPPRCVLSGLAELLNVSCEVAIVIINIIGFGLLGGLLIIAFITVKRRYEEKVRLQEKFMKSLGLDPSQPDMSGLDKWEIPRDKVVINRKIGEGAFGTVYGGEAYFNDKGWLAVAVKTLKVGSTIDEKLDFLSEVEVMKRFEHKNIIKLLGVCIKCEPVLTIMEFMLYGDLKTYLLARRHLVNDRVYEDSEEISNKKLTAMALDIARALSYLAQLKYVHRDIASRNCLVNAQRVVKLGDFGMTRPMYENDYYKFSRKGMLPVRWMSPESLGLGIFTPASDVWSYGVLLYEIVTFGSFPFQGMSNEQVLVHVIDGNSLTVPKGVKQQLENLIYSCWEVESADRPTAPEIVDFLAMNPRVVAPCLDVPLSSVQFEHSGEIGIQLPETNCNFSMPLAWPEQSRSSLTKRSSQDKKQPLFLDLKHVHEPQNTKRFLSKEEPKEEDCNKPLLQMSTNSNFVKFINHSNPKRNEDENTPKYVNVQSGVTGLTIKSDERESDSPTITQLNGSEYLTTHNELINSASTSIV